MWTKYPDNKGEWMERDGLRLCVYHDGAWVVWNIKGPSVCASSYHTKDALTGSIDKAKALAENAALKHKP
ncbi:MAG TPA: hypothetical protein PK735_05360 [Flavobacteriales bacterium]|nr:hypothetical protein [Flavobacteriales bacterium]